MTGAGAGGEPAWIELATLHLIHARQIELFGGLPGVRDERAIESALARPRHAWAYGQAADVETLAGVYLCALARQQGYADGNKRVALAGMLVFLRLHGRTLVAPKDELYALVMAAATGAVSAEQVGAWVRQHV